MCDKLGPLLGECCLQRTIAYVETGRRVKWLEDSRRTSALTQAVDCDCGEPQTMAHLLSCRLLDESCTADDLATVTERAKACARKWEKIV